MKVTNEVKNYIRNRIYSESQRKTNTLKTEMNSLIEEIHPAINSIRDEIKSIVNDADERINRILKKKNLVVSDGKGLIGNYVYEFRLERHVATKKIHEIENRINEIDRKAHDLVEETILKVSLGSCDYEELKNILSEIRF